MEQENRKYVKNWKKKMDNHGRKMESSIWMEESMCQITKRSRRNSFKKTMTQWI